MSRDWSQPIATEALNRREQQVQDYLQERALRHAQQASTPQRRFRLLSWRPVLRAPQAPTRGAKQQTAV